MKNVIHSSVLASITLGGCLILNSPSVLARDQGWSIVPYVGFSQLGDQSPDISAQGISAGEADISVDSGFTGGLSLRYDYYNSRWAADIGWEYRSNDSSITASDGTVLDAGNYASNTFYLNLRYALVEGGRFTPWVGGGLSAIQEVDIDSESSDGERSFEDSGSIGIQLMAGVDYDVTDRIYLSGELRYTHFSDLDLDEENGNGQVTGLDYMPVTLGMGIGYRF